MARQLASEWLGPPPPKPLTSQNAAARARPPPGTASRLVQPREGHIAASRPTSASEPGPYISLTQFCYYDAPADHPFQRMACRSRLAQTPGDNDRAGNSAGGARPGTARCSSSSRARIALNRTLYLAPCAADEARHANIIITCAAPRRRAPHRADIAVAATAAATACR